MFTNNTKKKSYSLVTCISILILFIASVFVLLGMRRAVIEYRNNVYDEHVEDNLEKFDSILYSACELGQINLLRRAETISDEINRTIDLDELKNIMDNNLPCPELDEIFRKSLQTNPYIGASPTISGNRNNIFVIINGKIVADYIHDNKLYSAYKEHEPVVMGSSVAPEDIIENGFYNKALSLDAVDKIKKQYKGLIVWQQREPVYYDDIPMYDTFGLKELHEVFTKYGVDGLDSFDILLPVYITEYGNIFGDYDIPGETTLDNNNKIIIVQKLNLRDYITFRFPNLFSQDTLIVSRFNHLILMLNIFVIIECLSLIAYALSFISYYNYRITIEDDEYRLCALTEILEEDKKEEN